MDSAHARGARNGITSMGSSATEGCHLGWVCKDDSWVGFVLGGYPGLGNHVIVPGTEFTPNQMRCLTVWLFGYCLATKRLATQLARVIERPRRRQRER